MMIPNNRALLEVVRREKRMVEVEIARLNARLAILEQWVKDDESTDAAEQPDKEGQ